jgi:hypothetical protein
MCCVKSRVNKSNVTMHCGITISQKTGETDVETPLMQKKTIQEQNEHTVKCKSMRFREEL